MRLAAMGMMMAAAVGAWAAERGTEVRSVTVCVSASTPSYSAQAMASEIFARVGVRIDWHTFACPVSTGVIKISFSEQTPEKELPGSLAYALPFEGSHIVVFYDRVKKCADANLLSQLLAYVLVHEITHILQGIDRHSATGIMKAHWSPDDNFAMRTMALTFAAEDELLLHMGLDKWLSHVEPASGSPRGQRAQ